MADSLELEVEEPEFDFEASVERVADALGPDLIGEREPADYEDKIEVPAKSAHPSGETTPPVQPQPDATQQSAKTEQQPSTPQQAYEAPQSWAKEMRQHWGTLPPQVQGYLITREKQLLEGFNQFRPVQEALAPHADYLRQVGRTPHEAVSLLMTAQRRLTEGTPESREAAYRELGQMLGLGQSPASQPNGLATETPPLDPTVAALQQELMAIKQAMMAEREQEIEQIRTKNMETVNTFAADPAHPYFDEVAGEIPAFISMGKSLQEAYEMAVWANPITRAKQQAEALTAHDAKLRENARLSALPKKKAAGANVRSSGEERESTAHAPDLAEIDNTVRAAHRKLKGLA